MDPQSGNNKDWRSKFEDFEYTPREEVWDRVQQDAYATPPGFLSGKFAGFGHAPRGRVWRGIMASMYPMRRRRIIVGWAAAASIVLLLGIGWQMRGPSTTGKTHFAQNNGADTATKHAATHTAGKGAEAEVRCPADAAGGSHQGGEGQFTGQHPGDAAPTKVRRPQPKQRPAPQPKVLLAQGADQDAAPKPAPGLTEQLRTADLALPEGFLNQTDSMPLYQQPVRQLRLAAEEQPAPLENLWEEISTPGSEPESRFSAALASNFGPAGELERSFAVRSDEILSGAGNPTVTNGVVTDQVVQEDFLTPIMIGARLDWALSQRVNLSAGPVFTRLTSEATVAGKFQSTRDYLGLAVEGKYNLLQKKRFSLYAGGGLRYDIGLQRRVKYTQKEGEVQQLALGETPPLGGQAAVTAGSGIQYKLTKKFSLYTQGDLMHYFYLSEANLWSKKSIWPTLQVGLRLQL